MRRGKTVATRPRSCKFGSVRVLDPRRIRSGTTRSPGRRNRIAPAPRRSASGRSGPARRAGRPADKTVADDGPAHKSAVYSPPVSLRMPFGSTSVPSREAHTASRSPSHRSTGKKHSPALRKGPSGTRFGGPDPCATDKARSLRPSLDKRRPWRATTAQVQVPLTTVPRHPARMRRRRDRVPDGTGLRDCLLKAATKSIRKSWAHLPGGETESIRGA